MGTMQNCSIELGIKKKKKKKEVQNLTENNNKNGLYLHILVMRLLWTALFHPFINLYIDWNCI
jgi:hypothetical protein